MLLDFAITTQKPTEICQVSCKNQSCISAYVSDDISSLTRVSDDISGPIRLWHVSPIRLHHVSLTHPQTPINRNLPKTFQGEARERLRLKSWRRSRLRSPEALLEPSFEASKNFKNFNFEYEEHSKRNHPNPLPRSQRSLESSSKASRNSKKPQIGETQQIQATKVPKNFYHKPSNMKNIQRGIIQIIFLDFKVHWNQAQKPLEISTNHKLVKVYGFKPLKPRKTSTTNLRRWRTHEKSEEREEQWIFNKLIARDSL